MTMIADTVNALGIYFTAMAVLAMIAYYLYWDRND